MSCLICNEVGVLLCHLSNKPTGKYELSDRYLVGLYLKYGTYKKVAERTTVNQQYIHSRVQALGYSKSKNVWTDEQVEQVLNLYNEGFETGDGSLDNLSKKIGKTINQISKKAREFGLTNYKRSCSEGFSKSISIKAKELIAKNGHPRGMAGLKHNQTTKEIISKKSKAAWREYSEEKVSDILMKRSKTKAKNGSLYPGRQKVTWKQGWREIGGIRKYYRSRWEANYARYLEMLKANGDIKAWEHEPDTFWFEGIKRGCVSYLPDFKVTCKDGSVEYHEVKGWMDDRSKTKLKRMAKYHPDVKLIVIDTKAYKAISKAMSNVIDGWE